MDIYTEENAIRFDWPKEIIGLNRELVIMKMSFIP